MSSVNNISAVYDSLKSDEALASKCAVPHNTPMNQGWDIQKTTF